MPDEREFPALDDFAPNPPRYSKTGRAERTI